VKKTVYHGRRGDPVFKEGRPIFFTENKKDAEWYAYERGDFLKEPMITEAVVNIEKPASIDDLRNAVNEVGVTRDDIRVHSAYEGWNEIDYLYVPKVLDNLKEKGFDAFQGWDVLTNAEILIIAVFGPEQIEIQKKEVIECPKVFHGR